MMNGESTKQDDVRCARRGELQMERNWKLIPETR